MILLMEKLEGFLFSFNASVRLRKILVKNDTNGGAQTACDSI